MKNLFFSALLYTQLAVTQTTFDYTIELNPININGLPGLHSYAFGQHDGKWLIIGGRKDGLHARQPFNAFPVSQNNDEILVIDVNTQEYWSTPLTPLPLELEEQLQSTNMNFFQDGDTLFIIGGYAFSATANDHITFPNLTSINVPETINAIVNNESILPFFKQISDDHFAVTGGQLGKIGNEFYLVGGHRFDGRYNPMGGPTFTQEYTDEIRKFTIDNSGSQLSFSNYSTINDPIHLHRRDYNLLPQIYPNGMEGYMISSGVFQPNVDLPYLYPVAISNNGITPNTSFNQYLSHYHSASANLHDGDNNTMYHLFFGGISQYYYQNGTLTQDNNVPFVKTISLLKRDGNNLLEEYQLPIEMPTYHGASAEFIVNQSLPLVNFDIISLDEINEESFAIGYIYGGIESPIMNPFASNQTILTSASATIYEVRFLRQPLDIQKIDGSNPFEIIVSPNPASEGVHIVFNKDPKKSVYCFLSDLQGKIILEEPLFIKDHKSYLPLPKTLQNEAFILTFVIDGKYFLTKKLLKK